MILILMIYHGTHGTHGKNRIKENINHLSYSYSLRAGSVSDGQIMHLAIGEHGVLTP